MSELKKRVLSAIVAAPLFLLITWLGGWFFWALILILVVIIQHEIGQMLEKQEIKAWMPGVVILTVPVLLMSVASEIAWVLFLAGLLTVFVVETFRPENKGWMRLAPTIMLGVIVPALFSGLLLIRNIKPEQDGLILTFVLLMMVWANDVFAYFGGKLTGKHKLAPAISPAKTIEGFLWGFAGCFLIIGLGHLLFPDFPLNWTLSVPFAIITGFMGPAGDLAESKLKRAAGIKDSSNLIPGHGGLYDRFDAVSFSAPASAIFFYLTGVISHF